MARGVLSRHAIETPGYKEGGGLSNILRVNAR